MPEEASRLAQISRQSLSDCRKTSLPRSTTFCFGTEEFSICSLSSLKLLTNSPQRARVPMSLCLKKWCSGLSLFQLKKASLFVKGIPIVQGIEDTFVEGGVGGRSKHGILPTQGNEEGRDETQREIEEVGLAGI